MANSFPKIDFGFRYGSKQAIDNTEYKNGTFNIATDLGEILVDINGSRISTNSLYFYQTEELIKAIENPEINKIYYAIDTSKMFVFNSISVSWVQIGGSISDIYDAIESMLDIIGDLSGFKIVILQQGESLPEEGKSNTIYFVPREDSDEDTLFDEYVWVESFEYFEKIGISSADLYNYYDKDEINAFVGSNYIVDPTDINYKGNINNRLTNLETTTNNLNTRLTTLEALDLDFGEEL